MKHVDQDKYTYEVLCVDVNGNCVAKSDKALCYALLSHSEMFKEPKLNNDRTIIDDKIGLNLSIKHVDPDDEVKDALRSVFLVRAKGPFKEIEKLRIILLSHLKDQKIEHLYVLTDEVSSHIANEIYPQINRVENALRKYLIKFLVTKIGPSWWSVTADAEMQKKIVSRKNNESHFSNKADGKAYLIDFGELGKIVYTQSSGFISRDDIYSKVMAMEESSEAVKMLKQELQSNYTKFFKDTFKDNNFQQKWEDLEKIRHKVAHNSLFIIEDKDSADKLTAELMSIIDDANKKIDALKFSQDEREAIMDNIVSTSQAFKVITKEEMIERLKFSEKWACQNSGGFLGLTSYVKHYLGNAGYDYGSSFDVIRQLEAEGIVEIYDHRGEGHERSVKAIKLINNSMFNNTVFEKLGSLMTTGSE
ncbi:hypothetical protein [Geobacter anodireducens]|uniref:Apea-like HEPN domain-containing protein n=1 Tax=Geobacter soli TaxID=1510391 RepID=A0A0C1TNR6_9BACT|nr:hypothetical protein [Geobacter soli]KIE42459.1 hypothetical protein SE37_07355 [Geobacter soli]